MNITLTGTVTVQNFDQKSSTTFNTAGVTSGSNQVADTIKLVTGVWTAIPTGSNADMVIGSFTNNDSVDNVYISLGATTHTASILTPAFNTCIIPYSGSVQPYAMLVGSNVSSSLSYTICSYN